MADRLPKNLFSLPIWNDLTTRLCGASSGSPLHCGGLWGAAGALALVALRKQCARPIIAVTATGQEAEDLYEDLLHFAGDGAGVHYFPQLDILPYDEVMPFPDLIHRRIGVLFALRHETAPLIVTPIRALLTRIIPPAEVSGNVLELAPGEALDPQSLGQLLESLGYEPAVRVERPGEFAIKGGIVDLFAADSNDPCRIEFDEEKIETLRRFSAATQRSIEPLQKIRILPQREILVDGPRAAMALERLRAAFPVSEEREEIGEKVQSGQPFPGMESLLPLYHPEAVLLPGHCAATPLLAAVGLDSVAKTAAAFLRDAEELYEGYFTSSRIKFAPARLFATGIPAFDLRLEVLGLPEPSGLNFPFTSPPGYQGDIERLKDDVRGMLASGGTVHLYATYEGQLDRLAAILAEFSPLREPAVPATGRLNLLVAGLSGGFLIPDLGLACILEREVFNRKRALRRSLREVRSSPIDSFLDLAPGDYVVHIQHGVGQFLGIERMTTLGKEKDYLKIEYRDGEKLYVPLEMVNLVQRYLATEARPPKLDTLGGKSWERSREKVRKNIEDMARELVEVYAMRMKQEGHRYPEDGEWQHQFEGAFEFEETPDQLRAAGDVKSDMESTRPMDRLVCGDVGFGKTEVAVRAAFKAACGGKQVAVLVPTTILAEQHYHTFRDRFALFPFKIAYMNRFLPPAEQKQVTEALRTGKVDVVIGTHRLLSADIVFRDLGLVVIDEEQRFGVKDKEKLKQMRRLVDVLTLTATPIPRTLHLSLIKVRDMSVIRTPPRSRLPVETYVMEFNEALVRRAILQELERGGQVFYLHNRVRTLSGVEEFLRRLVPRARIGVAHGQLHEHQLEQVMVDFMERRIDVLLCTSIIEAGLDIPNANTLIVDRADAFGLAQLYQLRGRVGRSAQQAYAYLFYPPDRALTEIAQKRLQVINEFTELGSGFGLAMRDMEIRGVGSLFGREQSGDILAVGFDMYCRLLEDAVRAFGLEDSIEQVETTVGLEFEGFIPDGYIRDQRQRIEVYKRIASCYLDEERLALTEELQDRFGAPPDEVRLLLRLAELKAAGRRIGAKSILELGGAVLVEFDSRHKVDPGKAVALIEKDPAIRILPGERLVMRCQGMGETLSVKIDRLKNILQAIHLAE